MKLYLFTAFTALAAAFLISAQNPQDEGKQSIVKDIFDVGDVPIPEPLVIHEPDIIAYPGDDINQLVREYAYSDELFVLGIVGKHSDSLRLCKKYGAHTKDGGNLVIQVVGINTPDMPAEIRGIHLYGDVYGGKGTIKSAEFHNLRVSTANGSRAPILDIERSERLVFNNLELYPDPDNLRHYGGAGMKWGFDLGDGSDYLHINNCRRGKDQRFEEHWAYLKSNGNLFITNNDIGGGNRTGFQIRSPGGYEPPHGPIVISNNKAMDYGWDWSFHNGGSCITVWCSLNYPVYIIDNEIRNAKYGCVTITQEPQDQQPYLLPDGRSHSDVIFVGNTFTSPIGDRSCVSISASQAVRVFGNNRILGNDQKSDITIDSKTAWKWGALPCKRVYVDKNLKKSLNIITWDGENYVDWN
tara:strand:- start:2186 stop:3421 length:1236 start_codon:yes stop_codon:yes gene_type:complete